MDRVESNFGFKLMAFSYKFRDVFRPRIDILKEIGIKAGDFVLDYGCGPGSYIIPLTGLVGKEGKIYAIDVHPLAIQMVQNIASKKQLTNVKTICSDCKTGLPDNSIDVVLLYDVLHDLSNPDEVLEELHRVLKPNGVLSVSDHHMKEDEIVSKVEDRVLLRLSRKGKRTYSFLKEG
ncbi:MAG: class I SAM-dependent methyltransferase [Halobacteriota archaeon]